MRGDDGEKVALGQEQRDMAAGNSVAVLRIGLFDGIGCLRVALDGLGCDVLGHISVEKDAAARRVAERHFPASLHYDDIKPHWSSSGLVLPVKEYQA